APPQPQPRLPARVRRRVRGLPWPVGGRTDGRRTGPHEPHAHVGSVRLLSGAVPLPVLGPACAPAHGNETVRPLVATLAPHHTSRAEGQLPARLGHYPTPLALDRPGLAPHNEAFWRGPAPVTSPPEVAMPTLTKLDCPDCG